MSKANTTNKSDPSGAAAQAPTQSQQQSSSGWSDFGAAGSSGYGDTAVNGRDETGYGSLGAEAPAEQGKLSTHGG